VKNIFRIMRAFIRENQGQDLAEYCLITAFIAVGGCAVFFHVSGGIQNVWSNANSTLVSRAPEAGPPSGGSPSSGEPSSGAPDTNVPGSPDRGSEKNSN
jgi:Flp pilus assembly pilin Flp